MQLLSKPRHKVQTLKIPLGAIMTRTEICLLIGQQFIQRNHEVAMSYNSLFNSLKHNTDFTLISFIPPIPTLKSHALC